MYRMYTHLGRRKPMALRSTGSKVCRYIMQYSILVPTTSIIAFCFHSSLGAINWKGYEAIQQVMDVSDQGSCPYSFVLLAQAVSRRENVSTVESTFHSACRLHWMTKPDKTNPDQQARL